MLASKSRNVIKRNMSALPAYSFLLGLIALLGYMAIAAHVKPIVSGGKADGNTIVPVLFDQMFPHWFAGVAFAAVAIGALVPAAIMSIAAANLFTRNIYTEYIKRDATPQQEATVSKIASLVVKIGAVAVILLISPQFSIDLQLIGGVIILQTLPAVGIALYTGWLHRWGLVAGWIAGMGLGMWMLYQIPNPATNHVHFGGSAFAISKWFDPTSDRTRREGHGVRRLRRRGRERAGRGPRHAAVQGAAGRRRRRRDGTGRLHARPGARGADPVAGPTGRRPAGTGAGHLIGPGHLTGDGRLRRRGSTEVPHSRGYLAPRRPDCAALPDRHPLVARLRGSNRARYAEDCFRRRLDSRASPRPRIRWNRWRRWNRGLRRGRWNCGPAPTGPQEPPRPPDAVADRARRPAGPVLLVQVDRPEPRRVRGPPGSRPATATSARRTGGTRRETPASAAAHHAGPRSAPRSSASNADSAA